MHGSGLSVGCHNMLNRLGLNTLRPRQYGRRFPDDVFQYILLNENDWISLMISLKFIPKVRINNIPALVQIMAWRRPCAKPLSEPMKGNSLTHICVTRPQWVNNTVWIWPTTNSNVFFLKGHCGNWFTFYRPLLLRVQFTMTQKAKFMGPTWGPPGSCRPAMMVPCWPHEPCYQGSFQLFG